MALYKSMGYRKKVPVVPAVRFTMLFDRTRWQKFARWFSPPEATEIWKPTLWVFTLALLLWALLMATVILAFCLGPR